MNAVVYVVYVELIRDSQRYIESIAHACNEILDWANGARTSITKRALYNRHVSD